MPAFDGSYSVKGSKPITREEIWAIPANPELEALGMNGFTQDDQVRDLVRDVGLTRRQDGQRRTDRGRQHVAVGLGLGDRVHPDGAAPPALLTSTTGTPRFDESAGWMRRIAVSVGPPGANGMMNSTGRAG
jgi:hypothetical protein